VVTGLLSCAGRESPQALFQHAEQAFLHGELQQSQDECQRAYRTFRKSDPLWASRFKILEAKATLWRGLYGDVLKLLQSEPIPTDQPDLEVSALTLTGVAALNTHNFPEAERSLAKAEALCSSPLPDCGYTLLARGLLASERNQSAAAEQFYQSSLAFARSHGDKFLEAESLLNLGAESLVEGHFDEAIDRSEAAYKIAHAIGAGIPEMITEGNIGWANYKLGDSDQALERFLKAEKRAGELHNYVDRGAWLTDAGYVYMGTRNFKLADQSFQQALELERRANSKEEIHNVLRARARLGLQMDDLEAASRHAEQALTIARNSGNHRDELYPMLVQGQIAARQGHISEARNVFETIEKDPAAPVFLKWEAEHSLALLYENQKAFAAADREYRLALATFESARDIVRKQVSQLSFLTNAAGIYDDYVHFLMDRGKVDEALRWANFSRARTLSEGLGLLSKKKSADPPVLNAQSIARLASGNILFYWLGEKQSYLWAITPRTTQWFPLPEESKIEAAVARYRSALGGPNDMLVSADPDGRWLYETLLAPAQSLLPKGSKVFIIPDGGLNNQNFETLLVPGPQIHYWIDDATVINASSLRLVSASPPLGRRRPKNLLLIGNSVAPNDKYPELPKAGAQMDSVAGHFNEGTRRILARAKATPAAYLDSRPEQFSYIHFVAHGTASRLNPLDSAIILSNGDAGGDSFKLYARDIMQRPLRADLVTISACYGAAGRSYAGEGLVGLSWAFLRAGSHHVIAALWDVADTSTERLMDKFYEELARGAPPDVALRNAKLALLHGAYNSAFYWGPFQLYSGS